MTTNPDLPVDEGPQDGSPLEAPPTDGLRETEWVDDEPTRRLADEDHGDGPALVDENPLTARRERAAEGPTEELPRLHDTSEAPPVEETGETEEVYVILPEDEASDIPVIETEAVDDFEEGQLDPRSREMSAFGTADPPETEEFADGAEESLDQIASELDDDVLAYASDEFPEDGIPVLDSTDAEDGGFDGLGLPEEGELLDPEHLAATRRRSPFRVLVAVAALLALAAVGYYYGYPLWQEKFSSPAVATLGGKSPTLPPPTGTVEDPLRGGGGETPDKPPRNGGGGADTPDGTAGTTTTTPPEDPVELARAAFRQRLLHAIERGFVGEVGHE